MWNDLKNTEGVSKRRQLQGKFGSGIRWLTQIAGSPSESDRRLAHLLAWLLVHLILLSMAALILVLGIDPSQSEHRRIYIFLIIVLIILFALAYGLNRTGHHLIAAGLTVASAVLGPWGSLALDPDILQGDFIPLTYVALPILLSSMLLPPLVTIVLAALHLGALLLMPVFIPTATLINLPSLVIMVFFTAVLSIVISIVHQRDIKLIEKQSQQLAHSNELIYALAHITNHIEKALTPDEIIQTLGTELSKIDITCCMAIYEKKRSLFTINYTSIPPKALEQMEDGIGFPLVSCTFSLEKLNSIPKNEDILDRAAIANPEDEIQILFPCRREEGISEILQGVGIVSGTELLRLPLVFEENMLGIVWIWGRSIAKADLPIMTILAKQIGLSLERARLFQEVQSLALIDPLTGLQNRRSLFELGSIELARAHRMGRPFCCMMLDFDHFKQVNDKYGHPIGDQVLQVFAERCKNSIRVVDLIGRYGGEELVIFLPETDLGTALHVAERLRASVGEKPIIVADHLLSITVSIGVATKDEHTLDLQTLVARADQAMYVAKYRGRNQVAISK